MKTMMQCFVFIIIISGLIAAASAQDVKSEYFAEADKEMNSAVEAKADILAPENFKKAMEYYSDAEDDYKKEKDPGEIRKKLKAAVVHFQKAGQAVQLAQITLQNPIKARSDAMDANSPEYARDAWEKAEDMFKEAARELEKGDINDAKKKGAEAEILYRRAELEAIKANYLNETWELLRRADKMKVKERAPKTLLRARELATLAEKELNENRYDTDQARSHARQAKYEVKHAIYLSGVIDDLKKEDYEYEDLLLLGEDPLRKVAAAIDYNAEFDRGFEPPVERIIEYINTYQDSAARLSQLVRDREQQVNTLVARVEEVEDQLGEVALQQSALKERLDAQTRIREQFETIEKLFTREEARVLRDGDDVIVRLVGLNFAVGAAVIEPRYFALLTKVQQAVKTFPNCAITVEGHTDSFGGDAMNLKLSQQRAEAIEAYLVANMQIEPSRINSVGYGESQPIANNETPEGRSRNRRIDIVIHPAI